MVFLSMRVLLKKEHNSVFIIDSFPVRAYENHRSFRARIFRDKSYHGYTASRKQYFFGIKVHMVTDLDGVPIEFLLTPGSTADIKGLQSMSLDLPQGTLLLGDRAYTDYQLEDYLAQLEGIRLLPKRKRNLKRQHSGEEHGYIALYRNRIETTFSSIVGRMPRHIKARTERGFCLKILFFILAYMFHQYYPLM